MSKAIIHLENLLGFWKKYWKGFILYASGTSIVGIFIAAYINKSIISLQDINGWISIVIGLVATIMGIISLILSFYNLEKANELNENQSESLSQIKSIQSDIDTRLKDLQRETTTYLLNSANKPERYIDQGSGWEEK